MEVDFITRKDLNNLKEELLAEIKKLSHKNHRQRNWIRSSEVQEMLNISENTLQRLRNRGSIPFSRIENTYFYPVEEINLLLNKQLNSNQTIELN
ncbi:MAG: helix-turn-helix domain-containing protein [Marinifilaceae bacterium]